MSDRASSSAGREVNDVSDTAMAAAVYDAVDRLNVAHARAHAAGLEVRLTTDYTHRLADGGPCSMAVVVSREIR
jgi:hypothetical protein